MATAGSLHRRLPNTSGCGSESCWIPVTQHEGLLRDPATVYAVCRWSAPEGAALGRSHSSGAESLRADGICPLMSDDSSKDLARPAESWLWASVTAHSL